MGLFDGSSKILDGMIETPFGVGAIFDPFKGNEKRKEINSMVKRAKECVSEGKRIYEDAKDKADAAASNAQSAVDDYVVFCKITATLLKSDVAPVMRRFDAFRIDSRVTAPVQIVDIRDGISIPQMSSVMRNPYPIYFPSLFDDGVRYDQAKEQLEKAEKYNAEMKCESQKLLATTDKLDEIRHRIVDEMKQIDTLTKKVISISAQLNQAMSKSSFTADEAKRLKAIRKIAEIVTKQLSTEFLGDNLSLTDKFKNQSNRLREINDMIPTAPRIEDWKLQDALRRIMEGSICY